MKIVGLPNNIKWLIDKSRKSMINVLYYSISVTVPTIKYTKDLILKIVEILIF